jgi:hypothetical protein
VVTTTVRTPAAELVDTPGMLVWARVKPAAALGLARLARQRAMRLRDMRLRALQPAAAGARAQLVLWVRPARQVRSPATRFAIPHAPVASIANSSR